MSVKSLSKRDNKSIIPSERIISRIFFIRKKKVMFDKDLAELYGVETRVLNQAVRRNLERFPDDFMFQLTKQETDIWRSQIATSNDSVSRSQIVILKKGQNIKYRPLVFTEHGILMLSSALKSKKAIAINIQIMRTFVQMREMILSNKDLRAKIDKIERQLAKHDKRFVVVFDTIKYLAASNDAEPSTEEIGFKS